MFYSKLQFKLEIIINAQNKNNNNDFSTFYYYDYDYYYCFKLKLKKLFRLFFKLRIRQIEQK